MCTNDKLPIMNENEEDLDLALALGSANYRVQSEPNNVSGAGVNAKLKVDMAFAASDPLSKLVWSPHKSLSLKCADSNLADKKPFLLWNVEPSGKVSSPSQSIQSVGPGDKVAIDGGISTFSPLPNFVTKHGEKTDHVVEERAGISSSIQMEDSCKKNKYMEEDVAYNGRGNNITELEVTSCSNSNPNATKLSKNSNVQSPMEPHHKETSASRGSKQNKADILSSKLEATAENELCNPIVKEAKSLGEIRLPSPQNEVCLYQEKGKEKALYTRDHHQRLGNGDDDGSNESVESCNSVGFLSRGVKRHSCDQDSIHIDKRLKKQGSHGSSSVIKPHSSFINWISNMVKGFPDSCNEGSSAPGLALSCLNNVRAKDDRETFACIKTRGSPNLSMGFQTMFQSLYCQDTKTPDTVAPAEHYSIGESEELVVADNTSTKHPPRSFHGSDENTLKQIVASNEQENPTTSRNIVSQPSQPCAAMACTPFAYETDLAENKAAGNFPTCDGTAGNIAPSSPMAMINLPGKSDHLTSLWITRLSTKTPQLGKGNQTNQAAVERHTEYLNVFPNSQRNDVFSNDKNHSNSMVNSHEEHVYASSREIQRLACIPEVSSDGKCTHKLRPAHPTPEFSGSSEAMASVFARRLDALKRIVPTKRETNLCSSSVCFFCGKSSHDLRECPEVTESEIEELLVKTISNDMIEESNSLCIRCFQFDHWAISCPLGLANKHCRSEKHVSGINPKETIITSHSANEFKENRGQSFPFRSVANSKKNNDAPTDIFHAIRKLRLSRVDILRWMDSHVSFTHLNGFFLRLRLAKLESGLGGTGYCVACIIGDTRENIVCRPKKSILVDVGGIKSSIGSQYISNDDFLEDEVKAWWCRILKTGCKLPSLDELNSRFKHRRSFGF